MVPSQGPASAATPVEIAGVGFDAEVRTDYGDGSGSAVQAVFAARLLPWDGSPAVDLSPVALTQRRTLTAVVPAGLAPGRYDLQVTDPAGRSGTLPDGFEVASSPSDAVGFRIATIPAQRAGVPFAVSIEAVDAAGRVVSGFAGSVGVVDESGTAFPAAAGPFALGRVQAQVAVAVPHAADRLTADDGAGRTGLSNAFDVGPGVPARIVVEGNVVAGPQQGGDSEMYGGLIVSAHGGSISRNEVDHYGIGLLVEGDSLAVRENVIRDCGVGLVAWTPGRKDLKTRHAVIAGKRIEK